MSAKDNSGKDSNENSIQLEFYINCKIMFNEKIAIHSGVMKILLNEKKNIIWET